MRVATTVLLCLVALPAAAQDIYVRAGEYDGFSRLVIEFSARPDWRIEEIAEGIALRTDDPDLSYDLSRVFRLQPQNRLVALTPDGAGGLVFALDCDCRVDAFPVRSAALAIDIHDTPAAQDVGKRVRARGNPDAPVEVSTAAASSASSPPASGIEASDPDEDTLVSAFVEGPIQLLQGTAAETTGGATAPQFFLPLPILEPSLNRESGASLGTPAIPLELPPERDRAASELLTRSLARELARAAAEGLVQTPPPDTAAAEETQPEASSNIRIETGLDRSFGLETTPDSAQVAAGPCRPETDFDVAAWGDDRPVPVQLAELRPGLLSEFDRPDPYAVTRLARLYIHLSFGAEAELLLETFGEDIPEAGYLAAMARVAENGTLGPVDGLAEKGAMEVIGQIVCTGPGAFWAALALPELPRDQLIDTDSILQTFIGLPPHLRRHLGPPLAARFARAGQTEAVETISNAISRVSKPKDPARVLTKARASAATGGMTRTTEERLRDIASGAHPNAAEALIVLGDELLARDGRIPEELVDSAELLSFERAGTADGQKLKALELRSRLRNGEFRTAFMGLDRALALNLLPEGEIADLQKTALEAILTTADDATFLTRILDPVGRAFAETVDRRLQLMAAERILALGLSAEAADLAPPDPDATDAAELGYATRLSLARGDPRRAAEFARRAPGEEGQRLLAESLARAAAHGAAARAFADIGAEEESLAESWRARDWARLATAQPGPYASAANAMLDAGQPPEPEGRPTLARARERAATAAQLRDTIDALFDALPDPPGG